MNELELAWAAGFFDGEGSVNVKTNRKGDRIYRYLRVQVYQRDERPLERFARAVGDPGWRFRHPTNGVWQLCYQGKRAEAVIALLEPFLSGFKLDQLADSRARLAA